MKSLSGFGVLLLAALSVADVHRRVIPSGWKAPDQPNGRSLAQVPLNMAVRMGDTVELVCESIELPPVVRIHWWEYVTTPVGQMISDNDLILSGHPNAARYRILKHTPNHFTLEIRDVQLTDGGTYKCVDGNGGSPERYSGAAELVVIKGEPNCTSLVPENGIVVETQNYTMSCQIYFQGSLNPTVTWTGPQPFFQTTATNPGDVFSGILFTVLRSMDTQAYRAVTNFSTPIGVPEGVADNAPVYTHIYQSGQLFVYWGPTNMSISPIKTTYEPLDTLTCHADGFPPPFYAWQDMRTLERFSGQIFTVTENMRGFNTTMRCQANNTIQGFPYSGLAYTNVNVLPLTTPTTPTTTQTTTPPPLDAPCRNISGWWISDDPYTEMHLHVATGSSARVTGFMRNNTDQQWIEIIGRTRLPDYALLGLSAIWPYEVGVTGMSAECHRCSGVEVLITAGGWRSYYDSAFCGDGGSPTPYTSYRFRKLAEESDSAIYNADFKVFNPTEGVAGKFGLKY